MVKQTTHLHHESTGHMISQKLFLGAVLNYSLYQGKLSKILFGG